MWSTSAGGHLMKVVNLTGFTVYVYYRLQHNTCTSTQWWNINYIRATCFRPKQNICKVQYVLHWPNDGCFTAETCSSDVIHTSSLCWCTHVVFQTAIYIYLLLYFAGTNPSENSTRGINASQTLRQATTVTSTFSTLAFFIKKISNSFCGDNFPRNITYLLTYLLT